MSTPAASVSAPLTSTALREAIVSKGYELRTHRATAAAAAAASVSAAADGSDPAGETAGASKPAETADTAEAEATRRALSELLQLKAEYEQVTGEEYRPKSKAAKADRAARKRQREASAEAADGSAASVSAATVEPTRQERVRQRIKQTQLSSSWAAEAEAKDPMALPPAPSTFEPWSPRGFFKFEVLHTSKKPGSRARVGRVTTPHGVIDTPAFVPVGTNAALKAVDERQSREAGTQLMFCNTYHLLVHPGPEVVQRAGGLHSYMNHQGAIITDSGGFQVFSLAEPNEEDGPEMKSRAKRAGKEGSKNSASLLKVGERGALFRSYFDGTAIELTPESSVAAQKALGSDIIIPLDELPPFHVTRERLKQSVRLSHRWMARSLCAHLADPNSQAMYGVVHGGTDEELRRESAEYLASLPFDGFAIGGSLGRNRVEMIELLKFLMPILPDDKPNHLLGIADPESAAAVVPLGVDTMDSCNPTRIARHGMLLSTNGPLKIKQSRFLDDFGPIDPQCKTISHSRAYLHHLFKQHEPLYMTLASQHNLMFMHSLMANMREKIMRDEI